MSSGSSFSRAINPPRYAAPRRRRPCGKSGKPCPREAVKGKALCRQCLALAATTAARLAEAKKGAAGSDPSAA